MAKLPMMKKSGMESKAPALQDEMPNMGKSSARSAGPKGAFPQGFKNGGLVKKPNIKPESKGGEAKAGEFDTGKRVFEDEKKTAGKTKPAPDGSSGLKEHKLPENRGEAITGANPLANVTEFYNKDARK